ncbi:MAG: hypothetical protein IJZ77_03580 [Bacilli bacterium]|nr:hypothetical protein [Bacilli bacterium]
MNILFINLAISLMCMTVQNVETTYIMENSDYFVPTIRNNDTTSHKDAYEDNNYIEDAVEISPNNFYEEDYRTKFNASLDSINYTIDKDIYYINILTDSDVSIQVTTSNSNYSFDMLIYRYDQTINETDSEVVNSKNIIYENYSSNYEKNFSSNLSAGTYFVELISQQPSNSSIIVDYEFDMYVEQNVYSSANIGDLRFNKGLSGALWVSDFKPLGEDTPLSFDKTYTYFQSTSNSSLSTPNYLLEYLLNENQVYDYASLFLWDDNLINALGEIVSTIVYTMEREFIEYEEVYVEIEHYIQGVDLMVDLIFTAVGMVGDITVSLVCAGLSSVCDYIFEQLKELIVSDYNLMSGGYHTFMTSLNTAINWAEEGVKNKVLRIPFRYSMEVDDSDVTNPKTMISFIPEEEEAMCETFDYESQTIQAIFNDTCCGKGKIYGIDSTFSFNDINSFELAESYPNITPIVTTIPTNETSVSTETPLLEGQYKWFSFTPNSTGKYYFIFKGEEDIIIDVSDQPFSNYSNNGIDKSFNGDYMISNKHGAYFSMELQSNQTKYFRVRKGDYDACTNVITAEVSNEPVSDVEPCSYHIHNYTSFTWSNVTHHYSKCDCGASSLEPHAVLSGSNICVICGGTVNSGFIEIQSVEDVLFSENGSYILPNGVIVLDPKDLELYLKGELSFKAMNSFSM